MSKKSMGQVARDAFYHAHEVEGLTVKASWEAAADALLDAAADVCEHFYESREPLFDNAATPEERAHYGVQLGAFALASGHIRAMKLNP